MAAVDNFNNYSINSGGLICDDVILNKKILADLLLYILFRETVDAHVICQKNYQKSGVHS